MSKRITRAADKAMSLNVRSDVLGGVRLASHLALLALAGFALSVSLDTWFAVPMMVVHGVILVTLFAPLHETLHRTAFRTRAVNDTVAMMIGFLHFLPAGHFRCFHAAHHKFVQNSDRDPELASPKPANRAAYLWGLSTIPYWHARFSELADHAKGRVLAAFVKTRQRPAIIREARWHVAGWVAVAVVSIAFESMGAIYFWLLPTLLGQPFLRFYLMAEHGGCPAVADVWRNTRTVRSNPVVRFLMWNMPYHVEHHTVPAAPFHRLPVLHREMATQTIPPEKGYFECHRLMWRDLA
jgi:fatty acid desaturase